MRQYQEKLNELGLTPQSLSKGVTKDLVEFQQAEREFEELNERLAEMDEDDEEREELESQIEEYEEVIEKADEQLAAKIQHYFENKDAYAERMKNVTRGRGRPPKTPVPNPASTNTVSIATNAQGSTKVAPQNSTTTPPSNEQKEEDSFGSWLLWGGLAIVGAIVGVNIVRNR